MKHQTSYLHKSGSTLFALILTCALSVFLSLNLFAQSYSGPLVITKGGTYTGNWESRNENVPAIEVRTAEPVVIVNANIRSAGYLIRSWGYSANITVRHTNAYGITPSSHIRNFMNVDHFKNVVVEHCYLENIAGINLGGDYRGNGTTAETVKIRYNKVNNIDGRVRGGQVQVNFVGFNFKKPIRHAEVAWNQVINQAGNSFVEDNINMHNTRGTSDSPIRIHNNYIQGAFPADPKNSDYSGGGIITDGNYSNANTCPAYIQGYENHLVGLGNYSMGIAGGNNIRYHHNRIINAATFEDGSKYRMYTSGLWSRDYYKAQSTFANSIDNNVVAVMTNSGGRRDISVAEDASFSNNTSLPGTITKQDERDEYSRWQQKLAQNGIKLGPNGSGSDNTPAPAPVNQAPAVALTSPKANAGFTAGNAVTLQATASDADGSVVKVEFYEGSTKLGEDTSSPYSYTWNNVRQGQYKLTAKATDNKGETKTSAAVSIAVAEAPKQPEPVVQQPVPTQPTAPSGVTGKITREFWKNTSADINELPLAKKPTSVTELSLFEAPTNIDNNYVQRIYGYVTAPQSGQYTFWLAGDNKAELWLSTSEDPAKKVKIATVNVWTNPRQWDKNASQQSVKINLQAGKRYYIEARHIEEEGGDNLAVGWQLPSGAKEMPIASNRLSTVGSKAPVVEEKPVPVEKPVVEEKIVDEPLIEEPVVKQPAPTKPTAPSTATGKITREFWGNTKARLSDMPLAKAPTTVAELTLFEAPTDIADNYVQRIHGYVTAPENGEYTFWISGDNVAELWLSTSEDPAKKVKIATVNVWTNPRQWNKNASQQSAKIKLQAGKRYYIEALHIEGGGGDNLAVGWELPSGAKEMPIAGNRLSPYAAQAVSLSATKSAALQAATDKITVYPNPFRDNIAVVLPTNNTVAVADVVIMNQSGQVVFEQSQNEGDVAQTINVDLASANLRQGIYILKLTYVNGSQEVVRLYKE